MQQLDAVCFIIAVKTRLLKLLVTRVSQSHLKLVDHFFSGNRLAEFISGVSTVATVESLTHAQSSRCEYGLPNLVAAA
jgi:hypothetical protein